MGAVLLHRLELDNFMLHRQTRVEFGEFPVLLLTGANGSGKTQILDALILAMGHHPGRVKKGSLGRCVGPFGDESIIRLTIHNPTVGKRRGLRLEDPNLARLVKGEWLVLEVRIDSGQGLTYSIEDEWKRKRVRRQDVRSIFDAAGVRADNRLAFTEEGTVNVFADQTGRSKLDLLLETTGLSHYRDNLIESMATIDKALSEVEPMRQKLVLEQEYLKTLEKSMDLARRRKEIEQRLEDIVVEESWASVLRYEQEAVALRRRIDRRGDAKSSVEENLSGVDRTLRDLAQERAEVVERMESRKEAQDKARFLQSRVVGQIESCRKQESGLDRRESALANQLEDIRSQCSDLVDHSKDHSLARDLGFLEPDHREVVCAFRAAGELHEELKSLKGVIGPLINHLDSSMASRVHPDVWNRLQSYWFSFVVRQRRTFDAAMRRFEQWADREGKWPPVWLVWDREDEEFEISTELQGLDLDISFQRFLTRAGVGEIGETSRPGKELLDEASERGKSVSCDGVVGTPWGGIAGTGTLWAECLDVDLKTGARFSRLVLSIEPASLAKLETVTLLESQLNELLEERAEIDKLRKDLESEADSAGVQVGEFEQNLTADENERNRIDDEILVNERLRAERRAERERILKVMDRFELEYSELDRARRREAREASRVGERPGEVRESEAIREERVGLEARLEEIKITRVSMERYEDQKDKVGRMEKELAGGTEHLENLRGDMKRRLAAWNEEVTTRLETIQSGMQRLLGGAFQGIRLRVEHVADPVRGGLHLEVRRKGKVWRDLAHLSGGEKVLVVEALILAMHLLTDSPVHAIDEFTQRLDLKFKAYALEMVVRTAQEASSSMTGLYAPQFLLLCPDTLGVEWDEELSETFGRIVVASTRTDGDQESSAQSVEEATGV